MLADVSVVSMVGLKAPTSAVYLERWRAVEKEKAKVE